MKPIAFAGLAIAAALSFTACDPKPRSRPEPAPGPQTKMQPRPGDATLPPDNDPDPRPTTDSGPANPKPQGNVIPPAPTGPRNPEYGIKIEGKTGYVKSPYDSQGRPIDVRGLPPGTEVEDPYTPGRTLLVP